MKKIMKASIGVAAVAALAGAGALMAFAWGPSRTTYTMERIQQLLERCYSS